MFGRTMKIPDELLGEWWRLVAQQDPPAAEPMQSKLALARTIVTRSHGAAAAQAAAEGFDRVVRRGEVPEDVPEIDLPEGDPVHLPALLEHAFDVRSTSEARRLIDQGGVRLGGEVVNDFDLPRALLAGALLQVGKRRFGRLVDPSRA
jgi:tyrosyl-tRNA synthetase